MSWIVLDKCATVTGQLEQGTVRRDEDHKRVLPFLRWVGDYSDWMYECNAGLSLLLWSFLGSGGRVKFDS